MVHPVTTTDILLQEVAGLLTEIRDLLQERPADTPQKKAEPVAASPATGNPKQQSRPRATKKT